MIILSLDYYLFGSSLNMDHVVINQICLIEPFWTRLSHAETYIETVLGSDFSIFVKNESSCHMVTASKTMLEFLHLSLFSLMQQV